MSEPFIGEIRIMGCDFAPRSWAKCDGQLLPISQYAALYSIIGTTYGGDGRVNFALPNLQGRAAMHPGRGPGLTPRTAGETFGSSTEPLTEAQIPAHKHIVYGVQSLGDAASPSTDKMMGFDTKSGGGDNIFFLEDSATVNTKMAPEALSVVGGGQPHENRQPLIGMNYCIALDGLYPSRS